jgi:hypothetical protein
MAGAEKSSAQQRRDPTRRTDLTMDNPRTPDREDQDAAPARDQHDEPDTNDGPPVPFAPDSDDESPLGDTDEHSDA